MSEEYVDTTPAAESGLGGGDPTPEPEDPKFGLGQEGEGEGKGEPEDWTASLPEDEREWVRSKGFKDAAHVAKSGREAEANMHRLNDQLGRFENRVRELEGYITQQGQQHGGRYANEPTNDPFAPLGQVAQQAAAIGQAIDEGQLAAGEGLAYLNQETAKAVAKIITDRDAQWEERVAQAAEEATAPLYDRDREAHYYDRIGALQEELGADEYEALAPRAAEIIGERLRQDPDSRYDPDVIDSAFDRALRERTISQRRAASTRTLDGGGGGRARKALGPDEAILREMEQASPMGRGISGGL